MLREEVPEVLSPYVSLICLTQGLFSRRHASPRVLLILTSSSCKTDLIVTWEVTRNYQLYIPQILTIKVKEHNIHLGEVNLVLL